MFHSVVKTIDQELGQDIHVSEYMLRDIVKYLRDNDREIITLDQAVERMRNPRDQLFTVLTFDDGYKNNLTSALPILEALSVPFTIFVNTGMMNGEIYAWWLGLRNTILTQDKIVVEPMNCQFDLNTFSEKQQALLQITDWIYEDISDRSEKLKILFQKYNIDIQNIVQKEALSPNDLKVLTKHPLVSLEGHAESHLPLSALSVEDALGELTRNKKMLEDLIQVEVRHLAYPFGNGSSVGVRETQLAEKAGFKTAVTTRAGNIYQEHVNHLFSLPRLAVVNHNRLNHVAAKLAGAENFIRNPVAHPIISL